MNCDAKLEDEDITRECPFCGSELNWEEKFYDCPFCGSDTGEAVIYCEYCDSYIDWDDSEWECEDCSNEGEEEIIVEIVEEREICRCPECGAEMADDGYCDVCGWPNNQGWIGENY
ncbi:hypothetical protein [uncultured Methanobrevibacter sp.]|uniref:hypothetical protein n=1 Tax=uncultured Methanobrevibacter sp. TaxID=253161 RepID=UPI0025FF9FED|nr:hypothetical protein [uncultured Methanobrevibacter sp.]